MSAENVTSLATARVDRDARIRSRIDEMIAKASADLGRWGDDLIDWTFMPREQRGDVAEHLASEIVFRYNPIAQQFKALYDVIELYVAAAEERGEDLGVAIVKALVVMMGDERYIGIATHMAREQVIAAKEGMNEEIAESIRRNSPSCIDAARARLVDHYHAMQKK